MQPVFIDDVGRVLTDAALLPAAANQLFELGGPDRLSMNDVLRTALQISGKKRPILHLPVVLGRTAGTLISMLPSPPLPPPPLSADAVEFINQPAITDSTTLREVLNPRLTTLHDGLASYLRR
jgi:uncharacterized protein YbjT (DUF2867 family)